MLDYPSPEMDEMLSQITGDEYLFDDDDDGQQGEVDTEAITAIVITPEVAEAGEVPAGDENALTGDISEQAEDAFDDEGFDDDVCEFAEVGIAESEESKFDKATGKGGAG
ncbi:hypothetical protein AYL99_11923 [Fonsecaea erecta]|uniref:Uncharacterized protein n=1 Tax=Fonsecaea erecta TaxID=1367422 RepID=A0A178Z313_9EURO|nr:hypothetical protein AYL99_11923 [Fonsecaea erecta]OAP53901.1 hypothetical protein AYL99_11923 [Fonsecaea erecta]